MQTLKIKPGQAWKHMADGSEVVSTHLTDSGKIGICYVEKGRIKVGTVERSQLFESYEKVVDAET